MKVFYPILTTCFVLLLIMLLSPVFGQSTLIQKEIADYTVSELEQLKIDAIALEDNKLGKLYGMAIRKRIKLNKAEKNESSILIFIFKRDLRNINIAVLEHFKKKEAKERKAKNRQLIKNIDPSTISKLSLGISPIHSGFYSKKNLDIGTGPGLELNIGYQLNNGFSIGAFLRYSSINNAAINNANCGSSSSICERNFEHFLAGGLILEYKIFKRLRIHARVGREIVDIPNASGYIYGGGISFYLHQQKATLIQSLNFTLYQSNNLSHNKWVDRIGYEQETILYDAIIFQLGWRIQFYSKKK